MRPRPHKDLIRRDFFDTTSLTVGTRSPATHCHGGSTASQLYISSPQQRPLAPPSTSSHETMILDCGGISLVSAMYLRLAGRTKSIGDRALVDIFSIERGSGVSSEASSGTPTKDGTRDSGFAQLDPAPCDTTCTIKGASATAPAGAWSRRGCHLRSNPTGPEGQAAGAAH